MNLNKFLKKGLENRVDKKERLRDRKVERRRRSYVIFTEKEFSLITYLTCFLHHVFILAKLCLFFGSN